MRPLLYAYPAFFVVMGTGVLIAVALGTRRARAAALRARHLPQRCEDDADSLITVSHEAHGAHGHWVLEPPRPLLRPELHLLLRRP